MRFVCRDSNGNVSMIDQIYCAICSERQRKPVIRDVPLFPLYCACGRIFQSVSDGDEIGAEAASIIAALSLSPESPCVHRGDSTRTVECTSCRGRVKVKVFPCALHEEVTIKKRAGELKTCLGCVDHA
jgi:hypothetical protein